MLDRKKKQENFIVNVVLNTFLVSFIAVCFGIAGFELSIKADETLGEYQGANFFYANDRNISQEFTKEKDEKIIEIKDRILTEKAAKAEALFAKYGSPMQGYGKLIVQRAEECGGDYRIIIAISGVESGFGRIPYKLYNPFGYLDGVQYSGWEEALSHLSCKISRQHLAPCNQNLTCLINRYGGSDTNKEKWVRDITFYMNQL